jgi:hypothetical protein
MKHTKDMWCRGIKSGDSELITAGGVPIALVIPDHCDAQEFQANCDLIVKAPLLVKALEAWAYADADPAAARYKGYYNRAREQRDTLLRQLGSKAVRP